MLERARQRHSGQYFMVAVVDRWRRKQEDDVSWWPLALETLWINMECPKLTVLVCGCVCGVCCLARSSQADTLWNPFGSDWSTSAIMNAVSKDAVPRTHMIRLPPGNLLYASTFACLWRFFRDAFLRWKALGVQDCLWEERDDWRIPVDVSGPSFVPCSLCSCIPLVNDVSCYEWSLPPNSMLVVSGDGLVQRIASRICSMARMSTSCSHSWRRLARFAFYRRFHGWRFACT